MCDEVCDPSNLGAQEMAQTACKTNGILAANRFFGQEMASHVGDRRSNSFSSRHDVPT